MISFIFYMFHLHFIFTYFGVRERVCSCNIGPLRSGRESANAGKLDYGGVTRGLNNNNEPLYKTRCMEESKHSITTTLREITFICL